MYMTYSDFPSELADFGLAAAADPQFAERLIASLRQLADAPQSSANTGTEEIAQARQEAAA
jgi:hypothetical protein